MQMKTGLSQMYGIGVLAFVLFLSTLIGVPVLPGLSAELGAGPSGILLVSSAALATVVVAQLFTGFLADRYSIRALILSGALLGAISSLLCAVAASWTQLLALRIFSGVADAITMPVLLAVTASLGKEQPGKFFGILRSSQGLSFAVGPAIGGLFSFGGLRVPFIADGLLSLGAFWAAFVLFKDPGRQRLQHDLKLFSGLGSAFSNKRLPVYLLMGISGLFGFGVLGNLTTTQAQLLGLPPWQISAIASGGAVVFSLASYVTGALSDRFGRKTFVVLSQLVIAGSAVGLSRSDSFPALLFFYCVFCAGEAATYLLCFVYASDSFERKYIATSMAVFDSVIDLSLLAGPLIAVLTYSLIGRIEPVFLVPIVPAMLAFVATAVWLPRSAKRPVV